MKLLLAIALNQVALVFIVAGFVAPAGTGQRAQRLTRRGDAGLDRARSHRIFPHGRCWKPVADVTWDQVMTGVIVPAIVALDIGGAIRLSRRIP